MVFRLCVVIGFAPVVSLLAAQGGIPTSIYERAASAFQQGKFREAEQTLRAALGEYPRDAGALGLMGVVLDAQKRYDEAEGFYNQAIRLKPRSASLLNNLGNHYLARGASERARSAYLKVVAIEPNHPNANLHLAQMSVAGKKGEAALRYLGRLPKQDQATPAVELLRAQALDLSGKRSEAESLLRRAEDQAPADPRVAFSVGMIYVDWKHYGDAEQAFTRALEVEPTNFDILYNLGIAAMRAGHLNRAQEILEAALKQRPNCVDCLIDLARIRAERRRQVLANLRKAVSANPGDPSLKARLGKALLEEGKTDEALKVFREVRTLTPDPKILADCGRTLLDAEQYFLAREFLERVVSADPSSSEARLNLAIAVFHAAGPEAGLAEVDKIPAENDNGDYFLLRAQILDAMGKFQEAVEALNRSFSAAPTRPDLYFQAALFLIKHQRYGEALNLLKQATQLIPDAPELLLTEAITLELLRRPDESQALLTRIESHWPEWSQPYVVNGVMLEIRLKSAEARPLLETAIALGALDAVAYYYLASAIMHSTPEDTESAQKAIEQALRLNADDAYIQSLAGKIAYARKEYPAALEHLTAAIRLWPDMVEARQTLSAAYRALGDKEKSIAELKEIVRIKQENRTPEQAPPLPADNLLFTVRPSFRPPS